MLIDSNFGRIFNNIVKYFLEKLMHFIILQIQELIKLIKFSMWKKLKDFIKHPNKLIFLLQNNLKAE